MFPAIALADQVYPTYTVVLLLGGLIVGGAYVWSDPLRVGRPRGQPSLRRALGAAALIALIFVVGRVCSASLAALFDAPIPIPKTAISDLPIAYAGGEHVLYGLLLSYPLVVWFLHRSVLRSLLGEVSPASLIVDRGAWMVWSLAAVGRIACYCRGCCYGLAFGWPGLRFAPQSRAAFEHWQRDSPVLLQPATPELILVPALGLFFVSLLLWRAVDGGSHSRISRWSRCALYVGFASLVLRIPREAALETHLWSTEVVRAAGTQGSLPVVPTQLLCLAFAIALVIAAWRDQGIGRRGTYLRTLTYYAGFRFFLDLLRGEASLALWGPLTPVQWLSLLVALTSLAWWILARQRGTSDA